MIREVMPDDANVIADIYNYYIKETIITFEEQEVSSTEITNRIETVKSNGLPWLVADDQGKVVGYAYASKWHTRCAFRFSVEVTVYLSPDTSAKGWGTKLYNRLLDELRNRSIHSVIAAIALPNEPSIALHKKFGMEQVGHFKEVGYKFDKWIDVGYWQGKL